MIQVSVVIVNYKVEKELIACLESITRSKPKVNYELIVVDNDPESGLSLTLRGKFPQVKYVKSPRNLGFGAGNNLGTKSASGDYLFFLNPDTIIQKDSIDVLFNFAKKNPKVGMVAPLLFDVSGEAYPIQGSSRYSLKSALVTFSFINKLFPNNLISKKFFHKDWMRKEAEEFDVVPGTAFMIKKDLFEKIGLFDENFFLYFEEYDLAERIRKLGFKNYIIPKAKIFHIWGASTRKKEDAGKIFSKSRFLFFKKHYSIFFALVINLISNFGKYEFALSLVLGVSAFLGLFRIRELMTFIGDQGWFYLSARDILMSGKIPLVGIASSHPWLHQGPFWTYILAVLFWIFHFNPLAPGYFTVIIGVLTVFLMYKIGSAMFSPRIGLISALLYATSPLIILNNRMPYHTSLIPLFVLLFICSVFRWIKGQKYFFPLMLFFLAVLYNFEIATVLLWFALGAILAYGIWKKKEWIKKITNLKIMACSLVGLMIPMFPMLIYDTAHGFPQTLKFGLWIGYHIARVFGFPSIHGDQQFPSPAPFFQFTLTQLQQLVFLPNHFLALVLLLGNIFIVTYSIYAQFKKKKYNVAHLVVYLILMVSLAGYVLTGTASAAYFPLFFPLIMFILAIGFDFLLNQKKIYALGLIIISLITFFNGYSLLKQGYLTEKSDSSTFLEKALTAKTIIQKAHGRSYNIIGSGPGSQFASFTMSYEYLTWWLGNEPSQEPQKLRFIINENFKKTTLEEVKF